MSSDGTFSVSEDTGPEVILSLSDITVEVFRVSSDGKFSLPEDSGPEVILCSPDIIVEVFGSVF